MNSITHPRLLSPGYPQLDAPTWSVSGSNRKWTEFLRVWSIRLMLFLTAVSSVSLCQSEVLAQEPEYASAPESEYQEGVPRGEILEGGELSSQIFPGTQRKYWIYVPAQYDPTKPACTMIVQDGLNRAKSWKLPQVMDNLIHAGDMPVTIGIFVDPGVVPSERDEAQPRFNRSFEYDSLGDRYARFLLEELIPEVSQKYNLSTNPNDRCLAGASSGGICAFNAAWERPDAFRRVLSTIGTFVGLRGGNRFPMLVRKTEPKPLRIFLQDGSSDLNIYAGDWWIANQAMLSALQFAGYDVQHVWGEGGHNGRHAAAIMPEALRWLWRDYPSPIKVNMQNGKQRRIDVLLEGEDWRRVSSGHQAAIAPTCNANGEVFFCDSKAERIYRLGSDAKTRIFAEQTGAVTAMAFGKDGSLYASTAGKRIMRYDAQGEATALLSGVHCNRLVALADGFYFSDGSNGTLYWSDYQGSQREAATLPQPITALCPTADQAFLHIAGRDSRFTQHGRIKPNGSLDAIQEYGFLHQSVSKKSRSASGMCVDSQGHVYVATEMGIQVMDQLGRVNLIIRKPAKQSITGLTFGGIANDFLFITCGESVYRRKLNTQGVLTCNEPILPPRPGL